MGVNDVIEWPIFETCLNKCQRLIGVRAVTCIDQRRAVLADKQKVVGREPAALEDGPILIS